MNRCEPVIATIVCSVCRKPYNYDETKTTGTIYFHSDGNRCEVRVIRSVNADSPIHVQPRSQLN